jgi:hypothetical protein
MQRSTNGGKVVSFEPIKVPSRINPRISASPIAT